MAESFTVYIHKENIRNANRKVHWAPDNKKKQVLRQLGTIQHRKLPKYRRARIDAVVSYPHRQSSDVANLHPTMKSFVDGLVDVDPVTKVGRGILPDDNDAYLRGPYLDPSGELSDRKDWFRFDITITELEPDVHTS